VVPLLVNTPGWLTGLGLDMLQRLVRDVVRPVYLLEVRAEKEEDDAAEGAASSARKKPRRAADEDDEDSDTAVLDSLGHLPFPHQHYLLRRPLPSDPALAASVAASSALVTAPRMRQLQLLSYLTAGSVPRPFSRSPVALAPMQLHSLELPFHFSSYSSLLLSLAPVAIPLDQVRLEVLGLSPGKDFSPQSIGAVMDCSVVALCESTAAAGEDDVVGKKSGIRLVRSSAASFAPPASVDSSSSSSIPSPPLPRCLGLGLVRGLDVSRGLLFVSTPLSASMVARVNLVQKSPRLDTPPMALGRDELYPTVQAAAAKSRAKAGEGEGESAVVPSSHALPYLSTATLSASSGGFGAKQMQSRHNLARKRLG